MKVTFNEAWQIAADLVEQLEQDGVTVSMPRQQKMALAIYDRNGQGWNDHEQTWQPALDLDPEIMKKELALYIHFRERVMAAIKHEFINVNVRHAYKELMEGLEKLSGAQDR